MIYASASSMFIFGFNRQLFSVGTIDYSNEHMKAVANKAPYGELITI